MCTMFVAKVHVSVIIFKKQGSPKDGYISRRYFLKTICCSLNLTKMVPYHWSRMGK